MNLLVLEGLDGSGKSTQIELLERAMAERGPVRLVSFPDYQSPSSALVKMYLQGDFGSSPEDVNPYAAGTFYAVDRYASYRRDWEQDYRKGVRILAARYATSNLLYQMGKLPRSQWDGYIDWVEDLEYNKLGLPRPDQVVLLDMPVEVSQKLLIRRYQGDGSQRDIHERDVAFLESCAQCAYFAAERLGWQVVSCARDGEPLAVEEVHGRVMNTLA